jgi:thioredoxin reductase (NADPH)
MSSPQILHVAGWNSCGFYARTAGVLSSMSLLFPTRLKVVKHDFTDRSHYRSWLIDSGFREKFADNRAHSHSASPFVWFSKGATTEPSPDDIEKYLGGHDDTLDWCRTIFSPCEDAPDVGVTMVDDGYTNDHPYDYDLVVIGGGSGGMAAAKEAANLGAKVACLDFVKPSPHGTAWGLGGTCVNVGCIPKKLMHYGAQLNEGIHLDTDAFGISVAENGNKAVTTTLSWETMRENVQNYIRGLNFKYRVRFREKNVQYLNKLAKFTDEHTIEAVDKKGRTSTITAARFLIATGGRPLPLDCEGGELAISSDDIFSLEKNPGKTLCVGASYISLECAGFLHGIGNDVTVAVRSILLRGFDRQCSERIGEYMKESGVKFLTGVVPKKLEKVDGDRIRVTLSDDSEDVYDTVLVAIGRSADTPGLGLDNINIEVDAKNAKIPTVNEQTSCPSVYAVGDVMKGCPELTPVAIQSGIFLSRRLFGGSKEPMDYVNICTTVFTPIEYACVGLSEDDAIEKLGSDNIEVYHSEFMPLEWSLSQGRQSQMAYTKVITDKTTEQNVLGIHFVGPNAGEVMQGFGTAMKQGLTYKTLSETVGIHPTSAEEITTLTITKSSGEDASAGGC